MRHTLTLFLGFFAVTAAFAQSQRPSSISDVTITPTGVAAANVYDKVDTVLVPSSYANTNCQNLSIYTFTNQGQPAGFIFGFNAFLDYSKGYLFNAYGDVDEVFAPIAAKILVDTLTGGQFHARIYSVNMSDSSVTLLGVSDPITYANIDTSVVGGIPAMNAFTFSSPVTVNGYFLAMIDAYSWADTASGIVLYANGATCGTGDTWESWLTQASDTAFVPTNQTWNSNGQPLNADVFMGVSILNATLPLSTDKHETLNASTYPVPANNVVNISYNLSSAADVNLVVTNVQGQVIDARNEGLRGSGANLATLDVHNWASGIYFYTLKAGAGQVTGKIVVE